MREIDKMNDVTFKIWDKVSSDKDIQKVLFYDEKGVDVYAQDTLTKEQIKVVSTKISRHAKKPSADTKECYISMWYGGKLYHHGKNIYYNGSTYKIGVFCDNDIIFNDFIGNRVCAIESIIAELFDNADIGTACRAFMIDSVDVDIKNTDYTGRVITIGFNDFNKKTVK